MNTTHPRNSNSVFTHNNSQQLNNNSKSDEIPYELIPLPSRGLLYPESSPLHGVESVGIRAMTAREEDILMSPALLKSGGAITELIKSCLIDKSIDPLEMISGDRNSLLFSIRITGYGPEYQASVECSECEQKSDRKFDLSNVKINFLDLTPIIPFENKFEFVLPASQKTVIFRFLTGKSEEQANKTSIARKKAGLLNDNVITNSLFDSIISIGGIEDKQKIGHEIRNMLARDSLALRQHIAKHQPDIITKQESTCQHCDHTEEVNIPLGISFLWPNAKR